jgi:Na+/proline symporter
MDVFELTERFSQLALAALYFAGIILAIVFWSRHPRQSLCLLIAAGLLLGVELLYIAIWLIPDGDVNDDQFSPIFNSIDLIIRAIAFALMMLAIFTGRTRPKSRFFDFDEGAP